MEPRRVGPGAHCWGPRVATGSGTAAELVYHLAGALGTELKELARRFGPEAAAGLVPLVVQALELLEKAAVGPAPDSLQVSAQQAELELRRLREENERLCRELRSGPQGECGPAGGGEAQGLSPRAANENAPSSEERAMLRQLKEVTDRQRDELRAHNRDLRQRSQETEALQEQLQRLLLVNAELRHKLAAVQSQLRAARDRESESERRREATLEPAPEQAQGQAAAPGCEQRQEPETAAAGTGAPGTPEDRGAAHRPPGPRASARSHEGGYQEATKEDQGQDVRDPRGSREQVSPCLHSH
ncbi:rab-interacting lysosomal protein isoform X3 [Physeter macrocephalus]|uniref:Rab-interacting lysosomal protein n=1 Tax=Physeter macrocephalus TaxID=9755 RepID=A0A455C0H8_PHYMC|nr:rab-interacting lysosomal protein isoform X3 [Physeter catodon]|eukprot:XP_028354855.1 rab-interacting lysosomal protein isoform X3 [Physeter catodon]